MEALNTLLAKMGTGVTSESLFDESPTTKEERAEWQRRIAQQQCDWTNDAPGTLNEADGYNCDLCKNRGYTAEVRHQESFGYYYEAHIPCKCHKIRNTIRRLEKSGLKNIIRDYTFAKFETAEPWQATLKTAAAKFIQDDAHNCFFVGGQSGCGKTHLCTAIAGYYLKHDKTAKYMLWRDDVVKLKSKLVSDAHGYEADMHELKTVEVLYIDDLFKTGKGNDGNPAMPTTADVNIAFEIINYRYNNPNLITIISSERTIMEITEIDEAIGGRIAEMAIQAGYGFNIKRDISKNQRLKGCVDL